MENVLLDNVVVSMVGVVKPMTTVPMVVNLNLEIVTVLRLHLLIPVLQPLYHLLKEDVGKTMENVLLGNVVVNMIGVVKLMTIVQYLKVVKVNLEYVINTNVFLNFI